MKKFYKACEAMIKDNEFDKIKNVVGTDYQDMYYVGTVEDIEHDEKLFNYYVKSIKEGYKIPLMAHIRAVGTLKSLIYYLDRNGYFNNEV